MGGAAALCAAASVFCAPVPAAFAQPLPRVKAKVIAFDGHALTLRPLPASPDAASGAAPSSLRLAPIPADGPLTVAVRPQTRYAVTVPALLTDIKVGDYAGAAVSARGSRLVAREVFVYPPELAGSGEGRFADNDRIMINGTVAALSRSGFTLRYRGAAQNGPVCEGRASPPAIASALACTGTAAIDVPAGAAVMALSLGDAGMISPGAVVTVSMARDPDGGYVTPGLVIQGAANVENPAPSP